MANPPHAPSRFRFSPRRRLASRATVLALALLAAAAGWFLIPPRNPETKAQAPRPNALPAAGYSHENRPIEYSVHGDGKRVLLFMASIHGTEGAGTPLLTALRSWLAANPGSVETAGVTVLVMPVANPDGLARKQRHNLRGVDLNRNFDAPNRRDNDRFGLTPLSEPESRAIAAVIGKWRPDLIVSVHQPLDCVDYDGPPETAAPLAERLAAACGLPVKKLGARPGSLGAWFGESLGKPILTLELPRDAPHDADALWARCGAGLTDLILRP